MSWWQRVLRRRGGREKAPDVGLDAALGARPDAGPDDVTSTAAERAEPYPPSPWALLDAAGRRDARAQHGKPAKGADPDSVDTPHSSAVVAELTPKDRRRLAHLLQEDRRCLRCIDWRWWTAKALADAHCGWSAAEVAELLRLALTDATNKPVRTWGTGGERALQLPLAALEELPPDAREPLLGQVRTALALGAAHGGTGRPRPGLERITARLRGLLGADTATGSLLPPGTPYATAARCGLGTGRLYDAGVTELLRQCSLVLDVRPDYRWLGSVREHLHQSAAARDALPALLAAARGLPKKCATRDEHASYGVLQKDSARLLGALAWAACVSGQDEAVRELARALRHHAADPLRQSGSGQAFFLRSGLAALGALAGEPGTGGHRRIIAGQPEPLVALAGEELALLLRSPPSWEGDRVRYPLGEYTAVFTVSVDGTVALRFRTWDSPLMQQVPGPVRKRWPVAYAMLRVRLTEVRAQVAAHLGTLSERLHGDPGTPAAQWAADFLDRPALHGLSRALIWQADLPRGPVVGVPTRRKRGGAWMLRDLPGVVHELADTTTVRLWDPRTADAAEAAAWRRELTRRHVAQPVPQLDPK